MQNMLQQGSESAQYQHGAYERPWCVEEKCKYGHDNNRGKNRNDEGIISQQAFHYEASS